MPRIPFSQLVLLFMSLDFEWEKSFCSKAKEKILIRPLLCPTLIDAKDISINSWLGIFKNLCSELFLNVHLYD